MRILPFMCESRYAVACTSVAAFTLGQSAHEERMDSNFGTVKTGARLLLAADRWHETFQFLERDVQALIAEVEQIQREMDEAEASQEHSYV
jgi:hypothetical protein